MQLNAVTNMVARLKTRSTEIFHTRGAQKSWPVAAGRGRLVSALFFHLAFSFVVLHGFTVS